MWAVAQFHRKEWRTRIRMMSLSVKYLGGQQGRHLIRITIPGDIWRGSTGRALWRSLDLEASETRRHLGNGGGEGTQFRQRPCASSKTNCEDKFSKTLCLQKVKNKKERGILGQKFWGSHWLKRFHLKLFWVLSSESLTTLSNTEC